MEDLHADWDTIRGHLQGIQGFDAAAMKKYFEEGPAKKGVHFFLVRYEPGEVIMAKGTTSDYAALHVQGLVRVRDQAVPRRPTGRGCWDRPLARRLENLVLAHAATVDPLRRGWLGRGSWPLALVYRSFPGVPLRVLDTLERWVSPRLAGAWRSHVARTLQGRLPPVRRAERELSNPREAVARDAEGTAATEKVLGIRDANGELLAVEQRFLGLPGTLWNQPRSVSLLADNDPVGNQPCTMLLIKRKALEDLIKKAPAFVEDRMQDFVQTVLPDILTRNRFFQNRLFAGDVRDWATLLDALGGRAPGPAPSGLRRLREALDPALMRWLPGARADHLDGPDRDHIIERLNEALSRRDLALPGEWPDAVLNAEARAMLQVAPGGLNDAEQFRLNRLLLEAAIPGALSASPRPVPLTGAEFDDFTTRLAAAHRQKFGKVLRPERLEVVRDRKTGTRKGVVVCTQGEPADSVILVLTGMVRVSVDLPGGRTMVNNLGGDTCCGEMAALDAAADGTPPKRTAHVESLCDTTILRLDRDVLRTVCQGPYAALLDKLQRERQLVTMRDELARTGRLLPPTEPPLAIAERLMLTRNVLLIDMVKCTRCDQCVRGCAEAHDMQPRFHRANPELRFGRWEVAGACLHCLDAPCQQACPVGAITLLDDSAVQIHRDRCIGCSQCANECPFGVIDMYEPTSPADAPSSKKGVVANKCDLCLTEQRDPPCVACCPYDAAQRVTPVEFFPELRSWARVDDRDQGAARN